MNVVADGLLLDPSCCSSNNLQATASCCFVGPPQRRNCFGEFRRYQLPMAIFAADGGLQVATTNYRRAVVGLQVGVKCLGRDRRAYKALGLSEGEWREPMLGEDEVESCCIASKLWPGIMMLQTRDPTRVWREMAGQTGLTTWQRRAFAPSAPPGSTTQYGTLQGCAR